MKKYSLFFLIALSGLFACCNRENVPSTAGDITISASVGNMTRITYEGDATHFTSGDKISVFAWTGDADAVPSSRVVDGVENTFDGSKWTPIAKMLWKNQSEAHYFLGISPVFAVDDFTAGSYTLNPADYTANDLLVATNLNGLKASVNPVALTFDHVMAKFVVNLRIRSELDASGATISVSVPARTEASVNYLKKTATVKGDVSDVALFADSSAPNVFAGIMVPQTGMRTVIVVFNNKTYRFEASEDIPLKANKCTFVDLSVGKEKIELNSVTVKDWENGGSVSGGDMTHSLSSINGHEYVEMGDGLKWATGNIRLSEGDSFFAFGEYGSKEDFQWGTYSLGDGTTFTKYDGTRYVSLLPEDDAARQRWNDEWRIPTDAEWAWLCDDKNCTWTWMTDYLGSGENGMLVTSKVPGFTSHSIFLPASGSMVSNANGGKGDKGCYGSSSLHGTNAALARSVCFSSEGVSGKDTERCLGLTIRPVASGNLLLATGLRPLVDEADLVNPGEGSIGNVAQFTIDDVLGSNCGYTVVDASLPSRSANSITLSGGTLTYTLVSRTWGGKATTDISGENARREDTVMAEKLTLTVQDGIHYTSTVYVPIMVIDDVPAISVGGNISLNSGESSEPQEMTIQYGADKPGWSTLMVNGKTGTTSDTGILTYALDSGTLEISGTASGYSYVYKAKPAEELTFGNDGTVTETLVFSVFDIDDDEATGTVTVTISSSSAPMP